MTTRADPIAVPDALGDAGLIQAAVVQLTKLQEQVVALRNIRLANGDDGDDPVPGLTGIDGNSMSYAEREDELVQGQMRVMEAAGHLAPAVVKLAERMAKRRSAELEEMLREDGE